jgi:hypothetical protein
MAKPQSTESDLKEALHVALRLADEQENSLVGVLLAEALARMGEDEQDLN